MQRSQSQVLRETTLDYLAPYSPANHPDPFVIEAELLEQVQMAFEMESALRPKGQKWQIPKSLAFSQIAEIIAKLYPVCRVACVGENTEADSDLLAIYQTDGPDEGIYVTSEDTFRNLARSFNYTLSSKEFNETMLALRDKVPRKTRCRDVDLVAVNNGIFNFRTKTLQPFSPDLVFLTKSKVNYNPNAINQIIYNPDDKTDWDVESWMASLSDDPEIVQLLWEILGAIIRPNVRWNKSAWFYSETGNNGKGTLCSLMRNLCGEGTYASIPIADFGKDFLLEPLTHASAVIVDENDVGTFVDKAANLKAVITNDVIQINRKFKTPIAYQFFGFMVQCLNEMPRIKDKSESFYRRQLFVPFEKCFNGIERKYIKDDYLKRPVVLEYVLHKVLHMNYYTLSEPKACCDALDAYKEFNDPIRQFFDEMSSEFVWDLLPFGFLYDLYKAWFKKNSPSGSVQGRNTFINDLLTCIQGRTDWMCEGRRIAIRPKKMMSNPEPLIINYELDDWKSTSYRGNDPNLIAKPTLAASYNGLLRVEPITAVDDDNDDTFSC